jgi:hypothetical protein
VVQDWPEAGTNCRSSGQIKHSPCGASEGAYCVPHVVQMKAGMRAGYISLSAAASAFNLHPLRWHVTKVSSDIGADIAFGTEPPCLRSASIQKQTFTDRLRPRRVVDR